MKKLLCLMICIPLFSKGQEATNGIKFEQGLSWEQVKAKAKAENKYIFMDVFATWCGPCKQMDAEVYPDDILGAYMNDKFISVKVQMDSTGKDNEQVRQWYADARAISQEYNITGFPTFLFFTPDAQLIYKGLGDKNVPDFTKLAGQALNPQNLIYYSQVEDYKKGKKKYERLRDLSVYVKAMGDEKLARQMAEDYINNTGRKQLLTKDNILLVLEISGNRKLADSLAKEYKSSYLDSLSEEELCTKDNLYFIGRFYQLINSKDKFFYLCYSQPERVDQVMPKGWANNIVNLTIAREEMNNKLLKNDKPVFKNPDWNKISTTIKKKYSKVDVKRLVLDYQIIYYRHNDENWAKWAEYKSEKINAYPPKPGAGENYFELNVFGAWDAFLHCNNEKVLTKALDWSELSIKLDEPDPNFNCLDTRANLLYKSGRVKEAIAQEEKAIEVALARSKREGVDVKFIIDQANIYKAALNKMKKGEPTYLEEGAVWDAKTLQKIRGSRRSPPIEQKKERPD